MKIKDITYILNRIGLVKKIAKLNIDMAGIDSDNLPFVRLNNGTVFYGPESKAKDRKYYNLLHKNVKKKLPFRTFVIAGDIVVRYMEGGLKYKGPKKEMYYKVKNGDNIAEMGAYMGFYTLYLSEKVGNDGHIIAIEPIPDNVKYLRKNIEANNIKNVTIVPKGVWKEKSVMTFSRKVGDNQSASVELNYNNNTTFDVNVDSLDNILTDNKMERINFMLIQLNGVEPEALMGLSRYKPQNFAIAARYSKENENAAKKIRKVLNERGYSCNIEDKEFVFAKLLS